MPTGEINVVVALTRIFEMLICPAVQEDPTNKNIRAWIMVGFLNGVKCIFFSLYASFLNSFTNPNDSRL